MKKLISIIILCVMSVSAQAQHIAVADPIVDLAGTWTHYLGVQNGQYVCTWVAAHNFSCAVSFAYNGGTCHVTYAATWAGGSGVWDYTATYNSGTCPANSWSAFLSDSGFHMCDYYRSNQTCQNAYFYYRTAGANSVAETNGGIATEIEVPGTIAGSYSSGGENATVDRGEDHDAFNGVVFEGEDFSATLKDPANAHASFSGHVTNEIVTSVSNTCLPITYTAGSLWTPDVANDYSVGNINDAGTGDQTAYDEIAVAVDYINRNQRSWTVTLPCTVTLDQRMGIDVPADGGSWGGGLDWIYQDHLIAFQIGDGWVKATRNGVGTQRNFGTKRIVWRTNEWMIMCLTHNAPCM